MTQSTRIASCFKKILDKSMRDIFSVLFYPMRQKDYGIVYVTGRI